MSECFLLRDMDFGGGTPVHARVARVISDWSIITAHSSILVICKVAFLWGDPCQDLVCITDPAPDHPKGTHPNCRDCVSQFSRKRKPVQGHNGIGTSPVLSTGLHTPELLSLHFLKNISPFPT